MIWPIASSTSTPATFILTGGSARCGAITRSGAIIRKAGSRSGRAGTTRGGGPSSGGCSPAGSGSSAAATHVSPTTTANSHAATQSRVGRWNTKRRSSMAGRASG